MRRSIYVLCLMAAACGGVPATPTATTTAPTNTAVMPTTTTAPSLRVEVQGCGAPPVTFSAMCEVYQLLQAWHVDQPLDPGRLSDLATTALDDDLGRFEQAPLPRTLFCAVPDQAFARFCARLAEVVATTGVALPPLMDHVVGSMVADGLGPFTYYQAPGQFTAIRSNGVVGGIGVLLDATDAAGSKCVRLSAACPLRVVSVIEDNPGAEAGLLVGDVILEVGGTPVDGQAFGATAGHIAGDEQGTVTLKVERDGVRLVFDINRAELVVPTARVDLPMPGVAYLRIPDFEEDMPDLVRQALDSLSASGADTMVLDLRDNPGGLVQAAVEIASEFITSGPIVEARYPGEISTYEALDGGIGHHYRVIVVVNQGSASAAEILAGALRDRKGSPVLGTSTFGKDAIQIRFDLRNGGEVDIAVARWVTPDGHSVATSGLIPDRELALTATMSIREIVEAALEASS